MSSLTERNAATLSTIGQERTRRAIAWLMVAFSIMSYFDRIIMSIAGPFVMAEFHLSETEMGTIYSAFTFTYAILMIPGGRFADRFGPRRVLTWMGLGAGLFTGLTALGGKPLFGIWLGVLPSFLGIRLALGVVTAPLYPSCAILNARWTPITSRAQVWGWVASGSGIGGALSPLLFAWMIDHIGWRTSFLASAVITASLSGVWYFVVRDWPAGTRPHQAVQARAKTPWRQLFGNRHLMLLTVSYATANYFEYIFFYWLLYYFSNIRHASARESAVASAVIWLAWATMTPTGGWISDLLVRRFGLKNGRRIMPILSLIIGAALLAFAINLTAMIPMVILLFVTLGLAAATDGPYWVSSSDLGGRYVGAAGGILNTGGNIGGFLAPIVTPWIASGLGWTAAMYAGSLILLGGVFLWFFIDVTQAVTPGEQVA